MRKQETFLEEVINVYRTKKYIVVQSLGLSFDAEDDNLMISYDKFYLRNKQRDKEYESFHQNKKNIEGRRIKTSMSSRIYIDKK